MKINEAGIKLIKECEGLAKVNRQTGLVHAYYCPSGVPTVGYGHTKNFDLYRQKYFSGITKEECEQILLQDLKEFEGGVRRMFPCTFLNENQFSALVSFAFNLGVGALQVSSLRKKILNNPNDFEVIGKEFQKWVFARGHKLPGLIKRRRMEFELYQKPIIINWSDIQKTLLIT